MSGELSGWRHDAGRPQAGEAQAVLRLASSRTKMVAAQADNKPVNLLYEGPNISHHP